MCGGTLRRAPGVPNLQGLSPRVRGNRSPSVIKVARKRSIPACAGEPYSECASCIVGAVYPRVCGGTQLRVIHRDNPGGLSPRVRGNRAAGYIPTEVPRSIPACAGEPIWDWATENVDKVYPRVCGGTAGCPGGNGGCPGLSPRVRGNPHKEFPQVQPVGSIPACAGEPRALMIVAVISSVYPRVCGGTGQVTVQVLSRIGLSPRVRGNPHRDLFGGPTVGSIPACAGEPGRHYRIPVGDGVYPRVCGGTHPSRWPAFCSEGLSPRVRGNPARPPDSHNGLGSIPACAGEPLLPPPTVRWLRVYPRVCGGTQWRRPTPIHRWGLSPRVRGNLSCLS